MRISVLHFPLEIERGENKRIQAFANICIISSKKDNVRLTFKFYLPHCITTINIYIATNCLEISKIIT